MLRINQLPRFPKAFALKVGTAVFGKICEYVPIEAKCICKSGINTPDQKILNMSAKIGWVTAFKNLPGDRNVAAEVAIENNQLGILAECKTNIDLIRHSVRFGTMPCFEMLTYIGLTTEMLQSLAIVAISYDRVAILRWVSRQLKEIYWPTMLWVDAMYSDSFDCFNWLSSFERINQPIVSTNIKILESQPNIGILATIRLAVTRLRFDVLEWLITNRHIGELDKQYILTVAISYDRVSMIPFAIANGAVHHIDNLFATIEHGHIECYELIRADMGISNVQCFEWAVSINSRKMVRYLHQRIMNFNPAFIIAAQAGNIRMMIRLRRWGATAFTSNPTYSLKVRIMLKVWIKN